MANPIVMSEGEIIGEDRRRVVEGTTLATTTIVITNRRERITIVMLYVAMLLAAVVGEEVRTFVRDGWVSFLREFHLRSHGVP
jgi:hypothetical protein